MDLKKIKSLVELSLKEDIGTGDITSRLTIPKEKKAEAVIKAGQPGILCGIDVANYVYRRIDKKIIFKTRLKDGNKLKKGQVIARVKGNARSILKGERLVLNFLQHLSGIATNANSFVGKLKNKKVKLLDTRKTIPGWRYLEKYAVKVGGAYNHRKGLYDMVLIKDNHIAVAGSIGKAFSKINKKVPKGIKSEIETQNLKQVKEALKTKTNIIMLDNMSLNNMKKAIKLIRKDKRKKIEISGGVNLKNINKIAKLNPDYISIGALTYNYRIVDMFMGIKI